MQYSVKAPILGFENMHNVTITKIDDMFATMQDADNKDISFTMVNPHLLREYSFELPTEIRVLLEIDDNSNISIYNITMIQKPLENSTINFLAPIIINNDNNKIAQVVLKKEKYPEYSLTQSIASFRP